MISGIIWGTLGSLAFNYILGRTVAPYTYATDRRAWWITFGVVNFMLVPCGSLVGAMVGAALS